MESQLKSVLVYTAVSYVLSFAVDLAAARLVPHSPVSTPVESSYRALLTLVWGLLRMYTPAAGAVAAIMVSGERRSVAEALGLRLRGHKPIVIYLLAPLLVLPPLTLCLLLELAAGKLDLSKLSVSVGGVTLEPPVYVLLALLSGYLAAVTVNAILALGEEVGWRGFLYYTLAPRLGYVKTAVAVGVLWGFWHATAILFLGHNYPTRRLEGALIFPLFTVMLSFPLFLLREFSGSVLPAASMHGALNAWWGLAVVAAPALGELDGAVGLLGILSWALYAPVFVYLERRQKNRGPI